MPRPKLRGVKRLWDWEIWAQNRPKTSLSRKYATRFDQERASKDHSPKDIRCFDGGYVQKEGNLDTLPVPDCLKCDKTASSKAEQAINDEIHAEVEREVAPIQRAGARLRTQAFADSLNKSVH